MQVLVMTSHRLTLMYLKHSGQTSSCDDITETFSQQLGKNDSHGQPTDAAIGTNDE